MNWDLVWIGLGSLLVGAYLIDRSQRVFTFRVNVLRSDIDRYWKLPPRWIMMLPVPLKRWSK